MIVMKRDEVLLKVSKVLVGSVVILHKLACISVSRDLLLCNLTSWSLLAAIKVVELC